MSIILKTDGLTKSYAGKNAVDNVSMTINKGDVYGFVGRNGAGKTTFIRMVAGLIKPTAGTFELDLNKGRGKMAAIVEGPAIYMNLNGMDNMRAQAMILGIKDDDFCKKTLEEVGLDATDKKKAKNYSLGMRQRLGIAMALLSDPEFLILDEPTNGLDPSGIVEIRELITHLNQNRGVTILVSSHILSELAKMATRFGIINDGALVKEISAEEFELTRETVYYYVVSDTTLIPSILQEKFEISNVNIIDGKRFSITTAVELSDMAVALGERQIKIEAIHEKQSDFEQLFLNIVSEERNEK